MELYMLNLYKIIQNKKDITCEIDVYESNAVDGCLNCGKWQEYYWVHECILKHSICSKGSQVVCTIGWMPDN